jgi:hypothetical protein
MCESPIPIGVAPQESGSDRAVEWLYRSAVLVGTLEISERRSVMHRPVVLMITALMMAGLVSCSDDDDSSSTTEEQTTVAVQDETTITTTEEDQSTASATNLPATSTVTVTVTNVEDATGYDLVA